MISRPAHGGFPGEVVVRWPSTDAFGLLPLGEVWIHVSALATVPATVLASFCGVEVEDVLAARGWTSVRDRTQG